MMHSGGHVESTHCCLSSDPVELQYLILFELLPNARPGLDCSCSSQLAHLAPMIRPETLVGFSSSFCS